MISIRIISLSVAAGLALAGCKPAATGGTGVPRGFTVKETVQLTDAKDCEDMALMRTKGGTAEPLRRGNVTIYEQTLNSGRRIWQSCTVEPSGGALYTMAADH